MQQSELKHELVLPEKFPLIRLYRAAWGKSAPLDFCHLFWGTLFCWVVPIFFIVISPLILCSVLRKKEERRAKKAPKPMPIDDLSFDTPKEHKRIAILDALVTAITKFIMWWKHSLRPWWSRHLAKPLWHGFQILGGLALLGGLGVGLYYFVPFLIALPGHVWEMIGFFVGVCLGITGCFLALLLFGFWIRDRKYDKLIGGYVAAPPLTAFRFMRLAYYYVKTNTCPRIVIDKED